MRPRWLIYENVKGMLSSNGGKDYLAILAEMDRLGYDAEWQNINSKWFVPQNRERIYTVGHLRTYGRSKVFPIKGTDGKDSVHGIKQVGMLKAERHNPNRYRVYESSGISPTLDKMDGGGREPHIITSNNVESIGNTHPSGRGMNGKVFSSEGLAPTVTTNKGEGNKIAIVTKNRSDDAE